MICLSKNDRGADLLIGYLEGTLPAEERVDLERHAQACLDCRQLLEVQQDLDEFPAPEVSPDFDARLYARIAGEEQARAASWWRRWLWRPVAPVALAAAAVAVVLLLRAPVEPGPAGDGQKQAAVNPPVDPQIELLEQALEDMELLMPLGTAPADAL